MAALLLAFALSMSQPPEPVPPAPKPPTNSVSPVIVTPRAPAPAPTLQSARDFVYEVSTPAAAHGQLARFEDPVCVSVEGADPPYDGVVAEDIRRVTREAGLRVDPPGCRANLLVLFTADVPKLMANLYAKRWDLLEGEYTYEPAIRRFIAERRPVVWWRITATRAWDGTPPSNVGDPDAAPVYTNARASHLQSNVIDAVARMVVVVDITKIQGRTLGQVADYVAFATLAGANLGKRPKADSIMNLFDASPDPKAPRLRLTVWDQAFLKAMYRSFSDRSSSLQEEQIAGEMRRILNDRAKTAPSPAPAR